MKGSESKNKGEISQLKVYFIVVNKRQLKNKRNGAEHWSVKINILPLLFIFERNRTFRLYLVLEKHKGKKKKIKKNDFLMFGFTMENMKSNQI